MHEGLRNKLKNQSLLKTGLILITYIFILYHISDILQMGNKLEVLLTPFFVGFIIAYLIYPISQIIQKILCKIFKRDLNSIFSLILTYVLLFLLILFSCLHIFPQLWYSVDKIVQEIPNSIESGYTWIKEEGGSYLAKITNNTVEIQDIINSFTANIDNITKSLTEGMGKVLTATMSITSFIINVIFGILISMYMLAHKDVYKAQAKKAVIAFFSPKLSNFILEFFRSVHITFSKFISTRIIDSTIIGVLCYIGCLIFEFDNALLIAFIVGITNVIPYFGPFLGAIPCSLIVLLQGPSYMIGFIIFILVLQQFDGNILGPKLLGDSMGLTSLWIIFAVVIMTGFFGIMGMAIGVPLFTIIYMLIKDVIYAKLHKKGKSVLTEDYMGNGVGDIPIDLAKYKKRNEDK